jgi:hypothetical protein
MAQDDDDKRSGAALPEFARRALAMGLSGFFFTEETVRKALGDTVPKDWVEFATEQSNRTREAFLERLSAEIARSLGQTDILAIVRQLLDGKTVEVKAQIRLRDADPDEDAT